jgi:hypothetical protein
MAQYFEQDNKPSDSTRGCYFHQPNDCYPVTEYFVIAVCLSTQHTLRIAVYMCLCVCVCVCVCVYRVSQEECARLRESVSYVKVYQYNPKHLYPKLNGYGDNGQRSLKL